MHLLWILVVAVLCVFGRTESASTDGANHSQDAHLIGGEMVDAKTIRPVIGVLILIDGKKMISSCEATLYRSTGPYTNLNYFLTAAECFDNWTGRE